MGSLAAEVEYFQKKGDLCLERQTLQPAWLRESGEAVGAHRAFIWGKGARQPHINGSGQRPTFHPNQVPTLKTHRKNLGGLTVPETKNDSSKAGQCPVHGLNPWKKLEVHLPLPQSTQKLYQRLACCSWIKRPLPALKNIPDWLNPSGIFLDSPAPKLRRLSVRKILSMGVTHREYFSRLQTLNSDSLSRQKYCTRVTPMSSIFRDSTPSTHTLVSSKNIADGLSQSAVFFLPQLPKLILRKRISLLQTHQLLLIDCDIFRLRKD